MSFWGGFVEGFATELGKGVDKAVDTDAEIVKDTVKIGVNKYLENEEEIKTEKKTIRDELDTLRALKFSLPKAASIIRAGQTANVIKLTNRYSGADPNDLWDGTTKFAEEKGLTVNDVLNKLVKTPKFEVGNLKVQQPKGGLLSALGLQRDISEDIREGIATRVGDTGATTTTRDDVAIMPGGLTMAGKKLATTSKDGVEDRILDYLDIKKKRALTKPEQEDYNMLVKLYTKGNIPQQIGIQGGISGSGASPIPPIGDLKKLLDAANAGDKNSENLLEGHLENAKKTLPYAQYKKIEDALK
tara:strand:- start:1795 stop:2697 length:903 start_codon:yes stop_codon:yes gene_type:complete